MQTVSRYLLTNLVIAYINGYHGRNSKVYDRRLKIFRGVSNPITFTFKNEDQKAQDIASRSFEFALIDTTSKKAVLTKTLSNYNTVQATSAELESDGSSSGRTARMKITSSNITGTFIVGQQLIGTTLSGPVTITAIDPDNAGGTQTVLNLSFNEQNIPSETVTVSAGAKGTASVTITDGDLLSLDSKFYDYSVREVVTTGSSISYQVTYADTGYNSAGTVELIDDGGFPSFVASTEVGSFTSNTSNNPWPLRYTSNGTIQAYPGQNNNDALHTIAVYTTGFSGTLKILGTMATTPASADFFTVSTITDLPSTGIKYYNFTGVYQFVKFSWDNAAGNTGTIDKILYRQ